MFLILLVGYKLVFKTKMIPPKSVDLVTGLRVIDEEEKKFVEEEAAKGPRSFWQRAWDSL